MNASAPLLNPVPSWYAATANRRETRPPLVGDLACDVCVVGGGFTGLMAALALAERGFDTVLLEAEHVGWGASGRNGGQIHSGFNLDLAGIAALVGPDDAHRLWTLAEEAKTILRDRIHRHAIACDLRPGLIYAASKPRHLDEITAWLREWNDVYHYPHLRRLGRDEMQALVASPLYCGGLLDEGGGQLHPLNYALGLAAAATRAGARLFEGSCVTGLDPGSSIRGPTVTTAAGRVRARWLVVATNGAHPPLARAMDRMIMPVLTSLVVTEPLGADTARALVPADLPVCDLTFAIRYFRRTPDHRLMFGGGVSYGQVPPPRPRLAGSLRLATLFPQLRGVGIDYCWGGTVAMTRNRLPHVGRLGPATLFAHGYSGHGLAHTALAGTVLAEAVAGNPDRFDVLARIPHRPFPGGRWWRRPLLVAAMGWYRLRDWVG
jgi:gamma-glutamylputrescine oxidase